ncbi:MAG: c-type cytochrome domain-containing protein, partial [Opitutaceae bacterium]
MRFRLLTFCCLFSASGLAQEKVTFNEHIRPILSDNCFACHGKDATHREAKLRLDIAEGAIATRGEGLPAITPGQLEKSELWWRITSKDDDERMPPADSHKQPLTTAQRALIKQWIEQGAVYQNHWAYEPVARPEAPV